MELAFIGRNRPQDQAAMLRLLAAGRREDFPWRWLAHCGFPEADIAGWRECHGAPATSLQAAE